MKPIMTSLVAGALALGCAHQDQLYFSTYTKIGLDISLTDGQPTEAVFGYKRFEVAIVPVNPDAPEQDAHALFAGMCIDNGWTTGITIGQVFATGEAAVQVAKNPEASAELAGALQCDPPSGSLAPKTGDEK